MQKSIAVNNGLSALLDAVLSDFSGSNFGHGGKIEILMRPHFLCEREGASCETIDRRQGNIFVCYFLRPLPFPLPPPCFSPLLPLPFRISSCIFTKLLPPDRMRITSSGR